MYLQVPNNLNNPAANNHVGTNIDNNGNEKFPPITFLTQNVQSLNISTMCKRTSKKIFSITREKDDVIFLCDTRLNSEKQISAINVISRKDSRLGVMTYSSTPKLTQGV
jgi:hypothetical protein